MTPVSIASVAASLAGLVLSVWLLIASQSAQGLQRDLQQQQQELQNKQLSVQTQQQKLQTQQETVNTVQTYGQQVGQVLQAMGSMVVEKKNEKMRGLLKKHGFDVQEKPAAGAGAKPASTPAPANP
jgi:ABC-type lipoprotein release transport system permease subunit